MKKHISVEQWESIGENNQDKFISVIRGKDHDKGRFIGFGGCSECGSDFTPSIGEMIEFLSEKEYLGFPRLKRNHQD